MEGFLGLVSIVVILWGIGAISSIIVFQAGHGSHPSKPSASESGTRTKR